MYIRDICESIIDPSQVINEEINHYLNIHQKNHSTICKNLRLNEKADQENQNEEIHVDDLQPKIIYEELKKDNMIKIFISHSSQDIKLVSKLVDLIRAALNLSSGDIRCTSLDGYKLPGGADFNAHLRQEVHDSQVFIGLLSQSSIQSQYVLFELGARWGAGKHLIPLLAPNMDDNLIRDPLRSFNILRCDNKNGLAQLVEDLSVFLNINLDKQSAYQRHIDEIIQV
jgi:hypothetical protein